MEHLLQKSICSIFQNIYKYVIFQRCQKVLMLSKGLSTVYSTQYQYIIITHLNFQYFFSFQKKSLIFQTFFPEKKEHNIT